MSDVVLDGESDWERMSNEPTRSSSVALISDTDSAELVHMSDADSDMSRTSPMIVPSAIQVDAPAEVVSASESGSNLSAMILSSSISRLIEQEDVSAVLSSSSPRTALPEIESIDTEGVKASEGNNVLRLSHELLSEHFEAAAQPAAASSSSPAVLVDGDTLSEKALSENNTSIDESINLSGNEIDLEDLPPTILEPQETSPEMVAVPFASPSPAPAPAPAPAAVAEPILSQSETTTVISAHTEPFVHLAPLAPLESLGSLGPLGPLVSLLSRPLIPPPPVAPPMIPKAASTNRQQPVAGSNSNEGLGLGLVEASMLAAAPRNSKYFPPTTTTVPPALIISPTLDSDSFLDTMSESSDLELGKKHSLESNSSKSGHSSSSSANSSTAALVALVGPASTNIGAAGNTKTDPLAFEPTKCFCCRLSWMQRLTGFAVTGVVAGIFFLLSFFSLSRVVFDTPVAFTCLYFLTHVFFLISTCFLVGPTKSLMSLNNPSRRTLSFLYFGLLVLLFYMAIVSSNYIANSWIGILPVYFAHLAAFSYYCLMYAPLSRAVIERAIALARKTDNLSTNGSHSTIVNAENTCCGSHSVLITVE